MWDTLLKAFEIYGDEEESYDCKDIFKRIFDNLEETEADIQVILRYLIEKTDFAEWIDKTYHSMDNECDGNCFNCEQCNKDNKDNNEQVDIFNAQAEILKKTQEELKALQKKYNKLLRKYKGLSN